MTNLPEVEKLVAQMVARVEQVYRDGWQDGYNAGHRDGSCDFNHGDLEADWQKSASYIAIKEPSK